MTCIVGLAHESAVWIAGDSAVTYGEGVVRHVFNSQLQATQHVAEALQTLRQLGR